MEVFTSGPGPFRHWHLYLGSKTPESTQCQYSVIHEIKTTPLMDMRDVMDVVITDDQTWLLGISVVWVKSCMNSFLINRKCILMASVPC